MYVMSKIRRYITTNACINIFKTMVLSLIEYCDIIYAGTTQSNLSDIDKLFYRGLRICVYTNNRTSRNILCRECRIAPLDERRLAHLKIFMHKLTDNQALIKPKKVNTRLQDGLVFNTYKPNNEKSKSSVLYRGAIQWNTLKAKIRNYDFEQFKAFQKRELCKTFMEG